ncbi:MAG: histidine triad nucleotide-binding protein [Armatimonadota bacterium]
MADYDANCIFCKIANKEMGSLIYEDDLVCAFDDIDPKAPVHVVVIPKKHIERISDLNSNEDAELAGKIIVAANKIAEDRGIKDDGYRLVANCNEDAGQSVWHVHFHLLGGRKMSWPPG